MQIRALKQLINKYNSEIGEIELDFEFDDKPKAQQQKKWALYQLDVRTLFTGYQHFLQTEEANEADYFEFFRQITRKGAPVEAMVGAAAFLEKEKKESDFPLITKTCADWNSNVHLGLQFAVFEYLTDKSQLGAKNWYPIVKNLLSAGADPNFLSAKYRSVIQSFDWGKQGQDIRTAFQIVIFQPQVTDQVLELASDFALQQEKIGTKMTLTSAQAMRVFPKVLPNSSQPFKSNAWFQWLEKNYPDQVKEYLLSNAQNMVSALAANKDYESIDHIRVQQDVDPLPILFDKEEKSCRWIETSTFCYLDEKMHERIVSHIAKNHDAVIDRFCLPELAAGMKYEEIDSLKERYGIDPYAVLKKDKFQWPISPIFRYLQSRDIEQLKSYIKLNPVQAIEQFKIVNFGKNHEFKEIDRLAETYGVDPFATLMDLQVARTSIPWVDSPIFKYLERRFPEQMKNYIIHEHDYLRGRFIKNADISSLEAMSEYKMIIPTAIVVEQIIKDLKARKSLNDFFIHPLFQFLEENNASDLKSYFSDSKNEKVFSDILQSILTSSDVPALNRLSQYKAVPVARVIEHIVSILQISNKMDEFCSHPLFIFLEENNFDELNAYFSNSANKDILRSILYPISSTRQHLADLYNVDSYVFFTKLNESDDLTLKSFYQHRCKKILEFIYAQSYPKIKEKYEASFIGRGTVKFNVDQTSYVVSPDIYSIIELLQKAINTTKNDTNTLYYKALCIGRNLTTSSERDAAENQIIEAFKTNFSNQSPMSLYIKREFEIKRDCLPLLMGFKQNSTLAKIAKDPIFEPKLIGQIFRFVGNYGMKEEGDVMAKESKDAKEESDDSHCLSKAYG